MITKDWGQEPPHEQEEIRCVNFPSKEVIEATIGQKLSNAQYEQLNEVFARYLLGQEQQPVNDNWEPSPTTIQTLYGA